MARNTGPLSVAFREKPVVERQISMFPQTWQQTGLSRIQRNPSSVSFHTLVFRWVQLQSRCFHPCTYYHSRWVPASVPVVSVSLIHPIPHPEELHPPSAGTRPPIPWVSTPYPQDLYATTNRSREPGPEDYDVKSSNWVGSSTLVFSETAPG